VTSPTSTGGVQIAIYYQLAVLAGVGVFGQAQLGFRRTTTRTRFRTETTGPVRDM
jgi:hypothetical protein